MVMMKTSVTREVFIAAMKTSVARKKEERSLHRRDEDLGDEEKGGEKSSWS
ncbi:hypothetical protein [Bacillus sp. RO1]|uniref:hypothetical protein n=1 Tax=Bacillus sp. RO1 TaxID=2722703 RepID=UPI0014576ED6|nr:hypothetical protein [Bacillus sp. RO1]NLP49971.1 hypothetical protein [Bacillus sp. RO1]